MKKVLKISTVLVLACALILGLGTKVSAAGSMTDLVEITSDAEFTVNPVDETKVKPLTEARAAKELTAKNVKTLEEGDLKVLWQKDVTAEPGTKFSFKVTGYDGQPVYAFHWNAETENWDYVDKGTAARFDITFPDLSPIGLAVELPESGEDTPKTGDNIWLFVGIGVIVVALIAIIASVVMKKKNNNQ